MKFIEKILSFFVNIFASLICPTWNCTQDDLDKMMVKKGYRKGYAGHWIMVDDINPDLDTRA
ncbi:MAG: hypothetical protein HUT38_00775 [Candidatus Paceibacter sp.]|nr:hypothetical protein [Candidatus Paceibacter sp.]